MSDNNTNVQNGVHSQLTAATVNSGVRPPAQVQSDTQDALLNVQKKQAPTQSKGTASEIKKWENFYSQEALKQPNRVTYYQAETNRLKAELAPILQLKKAEMTAEAKSKKIEGELKLAALRNLKNKFNEERYKENKKNNTSKKDKNREFQIAKITSQLEDKSLSKKKRRQLEAELSKWTFYSNDNSDGLPTGPDARPTAPSNKANSGNTTVEIQKPVKPKSGVTIERPNGSSSHTERKPTNPEYREKLSKKDKLNKSDKPKPSASKTEKNSGAQKTSKSSKSNSNRLFRQWKTQTSEYWRLNILDESVREWLHALYAKRPSISGRYTEPSLIAKIIKEDCHDIGYDKYVQSVMPYCGVTKDWLEKVINKQNFESWSTITFADMITNLFIQALYLVTHDIDLPDTSDEAWYVSAIADEKFIMSPSINTILYGNLIRPEKTNDHIIASNPASTKYAPIPIKPMFGDLYTISQRALFEDCYKRFMDESVSTTFDGLIYCNQCPAQIMSKTVDLFSFMDQMLDEKKKTSEKTDNSSPVESKTSCEDEEPKADPIPVKQPETTKCGNFSLVASLQEPIRDFSLTSLCRFSVFNDRLIETTFSDDTVVVRIDIMPVALEDDVATRTRRSEEKRCLFLRPTWRDHHPDERTYAINLAHFYSIAGRLSASALNIDDAIKTALSSYSDTPYIMPHAARLTLNSPEMIQMLRCIYRPCLQLAVPEYSSTRAREVCPTSDPIMRITFLKSFKRVRAIQIVPDQSESLRFITPNVENVSLAVGKRFNNAFNYAAFVWAYEGFLDFLSTVWHINPFRVTFDDDRLFDYVQSMRIRKNLTVRQFFSLLEKCVEISDLLEEDPMKVVRLLHYELWNNTKIFIKKELYSKDTTPRFIISPSPYVKLIYGCLIHQIEGVLYREDSPFYHFFIKHKKEDEIAVDLTDFNDTCPPGYVFVANDFTSFEGSQPKPAQCIIFSLFFSFTEPDTLERNILNVVFDALCSYVNVYSENFILLKCPGQWSGLPHTSCGNGGLNVINAIVVMHIGPYDIKAEGDDGAIRASPETAENLPSHSIFPCESVISNSMFDLSFCGRRLDLNGRIFLHTDEELDEYVQFNTVLSSHTLSDQTLYDMGYMRLLSLSFRYPHNPVVERCRTRFNERFLNSGLHLSKKGVNAYSRSNWYEMLMNPLDVQQWIRDRFDYPTQFPQLTEEDVRRVERSEVPALDLSETLNYRSINPPQEQPLREKLIICMNYIISLLVFFACYSNRYMRVFACLVLLAISSVYHLWISHMRILRTNNPMRYFWRYSTESVPEVVKRYVSISSANPSHLKLSNINSLPKESRMYGFNFRQSSNIMPLQSDPILLDSGGGEDKYINRLNDIARSSKGQPVRVTKDQMKLFSEDYVPPNLDWLTWDTEDDIIPFEVTKHAYYQFYPERIKRRLTNVNRNCLNSVTAQQACQRNGSGHTYIRIIVRICAIFRLIARRIGFIKSRKTHRNEQ